MVFQLPIKLRNFEKYQKILQKSNISNDDSLTSYLKSDLEFLGFCVMTNLLEARVFLILDSTPRSRKIDKNLATFL